MCDHCGCDDNGTGFTLINPAGEHHHYHSGSFHTHEHTHEDHHEHPHEHPHGHPHDHDHATAPGTSVRIDMEKDILSRNNLLAERNRGFLEARNITALNLVSSPGSGKTTLLERTIRSITNKPVYVIEGDQQTSLDANRIQSAGAPVIQVNTGSGCHLDAEMIHRAMKALDPARNSLLMIENVGNLVCPALFDLGENFRVVIISVTEGEDKPLKYPDMFRTSQLCLINKCDLLPYVDFNPDNLRNFALRVNPQLRFITLSAKTGEGFDQWLDWIGSQG